jgi:putative ABC transport system permease protein
MSAVPGFFRLATSDLRRRPLRTGLAILGVALSTGLLLGTLSMHAGYVRALDSTIDRMGYQVLVTAKGCPYEAASLMMRGGNTPMTIDDSTFDTILQDPDVSEATRIFMQSMPAGSAAKNMVFLGVDDRYRKLKPWMTLQQGVWFSGPEAPEALLGYNAALLLGLKLGDALPVGPTHKPLIVRGVFDRSGTQEDGMVIIPLTYSQELFDRQGKLTGVGVRLKSLDKVQGFLQRMFDLPSVQAVTMTQFRTTVLEFVATSRLLLLLSALVASVIGGLGVLNAMTMTVSERVREFGLMKAVGASPRDLFTLTLLETGVLGLLGGIVGAAVTVAGGLGIESLIRRFVPFVPPGAILATSLPRVLECVVASLGLAVVAGIYPAARAALVRPARVLSRAA